MAIWQNNQNKPVAPGSAADTYRGGNGIYQDQGNINGNPQGSGGTDNRYTLGSGWNTAPVRNHNGTNEVPGLGNGTDSTPSLPGGNTPTPPGSTPTDNTPVNPTGYYPTRPDYTAPTLPGANSQADYINAMYDANRRAQEDSLRNAYEQQVNVLNDQVNRLPAAYNAAADQVAAQAAIQQRNANEQMAASGLNTGAASQARLAQGNAYLGNIREVRQAQADAEANLNLQRAQLEAQYRNAIAEAIAQNDLQRAQALYQEAVRVDESLVNTAINQANMDWSVWQALYNR